MQFVHYFGSTDSRAIEATDKGNRSVATEASDITENSFVANWEASNDATGYYISVYSEEEGQTNALHEGFKIVLDKKSCHLNGRQHSTEFKPKNSAKIRHRCLLATAVIR